MSFERFWKGIEDDSGRSLLGDSAEDCMILMKLLSTRPNSLIVSDIYSLLGRLDLETTMKLYLETAYFNVADYGDFGFDVYNSSRVLMEIDRCMYLATVYSCPSARKRRLI